MNAISPSQIAIQAAQRKPVGVLKAPAAGRCTMCGAAHAQGELVTPFAPEDSFTDYGALKAPASKVLCGWCAAAWNVDFTQKALKTVMCKDGVFAASSNADIGYWVNNPPEGPWIWVMGDQKRQHVVWRTTVNTSKDVFQVLFGENKLTVRRKKVNEAADAARRLATAASVGRKGAPLKSPFLRLARDLDNNAHGTIRFDLQRRAQQEPQIKQDIRILQTCTPGELWALRALLFAPPSIERPARYFPS
jgi:CRISPR type IV-associated protein Csf1